MLHLYRTPALDQSEVIDLFNRVGLDGSGVSTEARYYVEMSNPLTPVSEERLHWLLRETYQPKQFGRQSFLDGRYQKPLEIGPRLNVATAWRTTVTKDVADCGIEGVQLVERSRRFGFPKLLEAADLARLLPHLHDRMTEMVYDAPPSTFVAPVFHQPLRIIPVRAGGKDVLRAYSKECEFGWEDQEIDFIHHLFTEILHRDATEVELWQLAQANSEHCRHGFWNSIQIMSGVPATETLFDIVKAPWRANPGCSVIAFHDNSSALRGGKVIWLRPTRPGEPSPMHLTMAVAHPTLTAETHNFPGGVCPFWGADTAGGGRERDGEGVGQGGLIGAAGVGYCTSNLCIPGYFLPWEEASVWFSPSLASPLRILIDASNGASYRGNCFGEPLTYGFTRTYQHTIGTKDPRAWFKPIVYSVGAGLVLDQHTKKGKPEKGMLVVQVGGPAYRIGIGGGSGSSMTHGSQSIEADFKGVQRGDPQMGQRVDRLVRTCVEMLDENPIVSIHDLGAGGDSNALPEIVFPAGARFNYRSIPAGDHSLTYVEMWVNEAQERNVLLIHPHRLPELKRVAEREGVPLAVLGEVTGDGQLVLDDEASDVLLVNLPLKDVLGELPPKTFTMDRLPRDLQPLQLPTDLTVLDALQRVLRLPSVCSKDFLTKKVDRTVKGLTVQQQCVGPFHLPVADCAISAHSHFDTVGSVRSLGEQPIKGLISPMAMARLALAEALLNMSGAVTADPDDVRYSANWMAAAKLPGEGMVIRDAAEALRDGCLATRTAIDGGKDSLAMAARMTHTDGHQEVIKAPCQLVIGAYAYMPEMTQYVTPDLKKPGNMLLWISLGNGKHRLGGSALAQTFQQLGDECPDIDDMEVLKRTFREVQKLVKEQLICSLHDVSDGGVITTALEMAFAGGLGLSLEVNSGSASAIELLFSEEAGLVIETSAPTSVRAQLIANHIPYVILGDVRRLEEGVRISHNEALVLHQPLLVLRSVWEETSFAIDALQANPVCVNQERRFNSVTDTAPPYHLSFAPTETYPDQSGLQPAVAVIRDEGSNGDDEMGAAFHTVGFEVWNIPMSDLLQGRVELSDFQGIAFPGGFSRADALGAGKAWAGVIRFNSKLKHQFDQFYERPDTFSFGVCNGCQLMTLMGWVPKFGTEDEKQPRFVRNVSRRFESHFSTVTIPHSKAIAFRGMAGSTLGVVVAHGEGYLQASPEIVQQMFAEQLVALQYVDAEGSPTETYPCNPNGSPFGITGICDRTGRHLAMMPHPERVFLDWQWEWMPSDWKTLPVSPWLKCFQNLYEWVCATPRA